MGGNPDRGDFQGSGRYGGATGSEAAHERRESLSAAERERVEATVSELLDLLGKAHAMAILRAFAFADDSLRFSDLEDALGVSPNTLSARLREFVDAGLLSRTAYDEMPPRVEYRATERAEALFPAFGHVHRWAIEHDLDADEGEDARPDADDGEDARSDADDARRHDE